MKGNNELILNESTMIEAVQEYLDKRMTTFAPMVKSIGYKDHEFKVSVFSEDNSND
jgi:hypothetical protein